MARDDSGIGRPSSVPGSADTPLGRIRMALSLLVHASVDTRETLFHNIREAIVELQEKDRSSIEDRGKVAILFSEHLDEFPDEHREIIEAFIDLNPEEHHLAKGKKLLAELSRNIDESRKKEIATEALGNFILLNENRYKTKAIKALLDAVKDIPDELLDRTLRYSLNGILLVGRSILENKERSSGVSFLESVVGNVLEQWQVSEDKGDSLINSDSMHADVLAAIVETVALASEYLSDEEKIQIFGDVIEKVDSLRQALGIAELPEKLNITADMLDSWGITAEEVSRLKAAPDTGR